MAKVGRMVKESMVQELATELGEQPNFYVTSVNRLSAADTDTLRSQLNASAARLVMMKQTLSRLALEKLKGTPKTRRQGLVALAVKENAHAMPGQAFLYSDLNYAVAGALLERSTGVPWEELITRHITEPLGMSTFGSGAPGHAVEIDQPRGHLLEGAQWKSLTPGPGADLASPVIAPAGTIHCSIADWARYAGAYLGRGPFPREAIRDLHQDPYHQNYGLGWVITKTTWGGSPVLTHTGSCGAWAALIWIAPGKDIAFVAASNYGGQVAFAACGEAIDSLVTTFLLD